MLDKYNDEIMKKINAHLGPGHRVSPYDLTSVKDLNEALLQTVAAYRDYWYYKTTLIGLVENFDESLEYCDTAAWLDLAQAPEIVDDLTVEGFAVLDAAADVFERLTERAKKNCAKVVIAALSAPPATQKAVLGRAYKIAPQDMNARIDALFDMLGEADYHYSMPENLEVFLEVMKEQWSALA